MTTTYAIEILTFNDDGGTANEPYICYENININKVKEEFKKLLNKKSDLYLPIKNNTALRKFFDARIIRNSLHQSVIVDWKQCLPRNVSILYRKRIKNGKELSKRIYQIGAWLYDTRYFSNDLKSENSLRFAKHILEEFNALPQYGNAFGLVLVDLIENEKEIFEI